MPTTRQMSTSDDEGSLHLIECNGTGINGDGCVAWVSTWLPKKLPRGFNERRFLCGYCAASEVEALKQTLNNAPLSTETQSSGLASVINADAVEQYGRRDNIRIFGMEEASGEDTYETVIQAAAATGVNITRADISVCHRLPSRRGPRPIIAKFVRREVKSSIMRGKRQLRERTDKIYINDDITPLRAKLSKVLRDREDVKFVNFVNEKITICYTNDERKTFNNLFELYKIAPNDVLSVCKSMPNFQ